MSIRPRCGLTEDAAMREMTGDDGLAVVFNATGSLASMERSFERAAQGGRSSSSASARHVWASPTLSSTTGR